MMDRRTFIAATVATPVIAATQASAGSSEIQALIHEWAKRSKAGHSDEAIEAALKDMSDLEDRIVAIPAQSAADLAAKIYAITGAFCFDIDGPNASALEAEIKELAGV